MQTNKMPEIMDSYDFWWVSAHSLGVDPDLILDENHWTKLLLLQEQRTLLVVRDVNSLIQQIFWVSGFIYDMKQPRYGSSLLFFWENSTWIHLIFLPTNLRSLCPFEINFNTSMTCGSWFILLELIQSTGELPVWSLVLAFIYHFISLLIFQWLWRISNFQYHHKLLFILMKSGFGIWLYFHSDILDLFLVWPNFVVEVSYCFISSPLRILYLFWIFGLLIKDGSG